MEKKRYSVEQRMAIEMAKAQARQLYHPVVLIDEQENRSIYMSIRALRLFVRIYGCAEEDRSSQVAGAARDWTETIRPICQETLGYTR